MDINNHELHVSYIRLTESFYSYCGNRSLAPEVDHFMQQCAAGLWHSGCFSGQAELDVINQLYSKGSSSPSILYWQLAAQVSGYSGFFVPAFFRELIFSDSRTGRQASGTFIRVFKAILLSIAALDENVSLSEAGFITDCVEMLEAACREKGIAIGEKGIDAGAYISKSGTAARTESESKSNADEPSLDELLDELVGLDEIKAEVKSLINLIKIRRLREENSLPIPAMSLHMVFLATPAPAKLL